MLRRLQSGWVILLLAACHTVGDLTDWQFSDNPGSGGATGTGGSNQGGAPGCDPASCPGNEGVCHVAYCNAADECALEISEGTVCDANAGKVCNAVGSCVECLEEEHCLVDEICDHGFCVPGTCNDNMQTDPETGVDCGGPDCAPCENTEICVDDSDCLSGFCDPALMECAPCAQHSDCDSGFWCDDTIAGGTCMPQGGEGEPCTEDAQCLYGCDTNDCGFCLKQGDSNYCSGDND